MFKLERRYIASSLPVLPTVPMLGVIDSRKVLRLQAYPVALHMINLVAVELTDINDRSALSLDLPTKFKDSFCCTHARQPNMSPFISNGKSRSTQQVSSGGKAIAIIGSGCRFPGHANTPSKLWELLENPKDVSSPLPASRFHAAGFYHRDSAHHGHSNVKDLRGYFLSEEGVERKFDANFFGINNAEANVLDPQMRLLLEVTYEALENAGIKIESLQGTNTGCFVGLMSGEYESAMLKDPETIGTYHATGTARSFLSNRLSYFFDWHGPSMTIDTACSSSLVAVHQAVQLLRSGQSNVAIAAGSNMIMDSTNYISESKLQMLSPDGQSRMWDANGNGYARGEGVCTIIMKRLKDALADGDYIECIIRETGCNSDGRTNGITRYM